MPGLPTIANVYRVTFNWSAVDGVTPRNVIHLHAASSNEASLGANIDTAIAAMASPSHMFHACNDAQVCADVDILKLDGTSATVNYPLATHLTGGQGSGQIIPQGCALVSFHTIFRGPAHRGRVYVGPIAESAQSNGVVDSTSRGLMLAAWNAFHASGLGSSPGFDLAVASYVHASWASVATIRVDSIAATQRRRINQLR